MTVPGRILLVAIMCSTVLQMTPVIIQDGPQRIVERTVWEVCHIVETENVWLRSGRAWFFDGASRHTWLQGDPITRWDSAWPACSGGMIRGPFGGTMYPGSP